MSFNEKLLKLRKENKLSQEQLAEELDVTRQSVSKWESGQTYPEMDKLISLCKLFNCTLEELTNDEIKEFNQVEKKNTFNSIIDSILEIIGKTYNMFTTMNYKEIIRCIFTMFIIGLILSILHFPINYLEYNISEMFSYLGNPFIANFFSIFITIMLDTIYLAFFVLLFVYIFKIGFLDKYSFIEKKEEKNHVDEELIKENNNLEKNIKIKRINKSNGPIFGLLASLVIFGLKLLLFMFTIPFIISIIFLYIALVIDIYLLFKGIFFISILLGIIFLIILNTLLLEFVFNLFFDKKQAYKRMLITFIIGISGIGTAIGLFAIDISNFTFSDNNQIQYNDQKKYNYDFNKEIYIIDYYHDSVEYLVDNTLNDKINITLNYNADFHNLDLEKDGNTFYVHSSYNYHFNKIIEMVVSDLKKNRIYNYEYLDYYTLTVVSSENNIKILKNNYEKYLKNEEENNFQEIINNYEDRISNSENIINEKNNIISDLEIKIDELKNQNEETKNKLEEYKIKVKDLLE